jgi:plastocyanin
MTDTSKIWIAVIVALVIGWVIGNFIHIPRPHPSVTAPPAVPEPPASETNVIKITDTGFNPSTITIKAGEVVTFVSKATAPVWPAGNPHPTHDAYPSDSYALAGDQAKSFGSKACIEYGIRKGNVFDPCQMLLPEQTFSFRFNEKGSWSFHNHVRPEHAGTIIVE